ncbi:MAG: GDSL-type esterase/lipase family protein [Oscillospiraceae bacterium]|nr:GDSL-type esterase/lipase family protein [Oscillospiraceae bacterium]
MHERKKKIPAVLFAAIVMLNCGLSAEAAEQKKIRLMCMGDSITDGFWLQGGYRNTLCQSITDNGLESEIDMVGPNWGGNIYDPQHAGFSGYSIDNIAQENSISGGRTGLSSFAGSMLQEHPADLVFLQIGTNDILSLYDLEHFGERLEGLVNIVLEALPEEGALCLATLPVMDANDHLYINEYFFTPDSMDEAVDLCNSQIRALADKLEKAGQPVYLAEVNHILDKNDLYDGVHPSEAGYAKLGNYWYAKLNDYRNGTLQSDVTATDAPDKGDVNADGRLSIADTVLLSRYLCTQSQMTDSQAKQADMDENGRINAVDFSLLKRSIIKDA